MVFQVGRTIGLRRIVPLVAAGVLAAALAKEWFRDRSALPTTKPGELDRSAC